MPQEFPALPTSPDDNDSHQEKKEEKRLSYAEAFAAARLLHTSGIENPISGQYEEPELQAAWDTIDEWEQRLDLHMRGVGTTDKAQNIVLASTLFLDAGYDDPETIHDARNRLSSEHVEALREGQEEAAQILADAIEKIEQRFPSVDPKQEKISYLESKLLEGEQLFQAGRFLSAVTTLYGTLTDPFFKRNKKLTADLRKKLEEQLAKAEAANKEEKEKKK